MEDIVKANVASASEKQNRTNKKKRVLTEEKKTFPNRKERREYEKRNGILKKKKQILDTSLNAWMKIVTESIKQGKYMHESNRDIWRKEIEKQLQEKESSIVDLLKSQGKDDKYINSYMERWVQHAIGDTW